MKFIIDAQLPKTLCEFLIRQGYDSIHTIDLPQKNFTSDKEVIEISVKQNRIVITKDNDFLQSFLIRSQPKKLILVRMGNLSNKELLAFFDDNLTTILSMIERSNLIEISRYDIAERD